MIDISIIIFVASLITIIVMFVFQYKKLKSKGELDKNFPPRELSYESFRNFTIRLKNLWLIFIHSSAILISRVWARITHKLSFWFNKITKKIEEQIIKSEKINQNKDLNQSVFITTIKAYKTEIKKLKGRVEPDKPKPRIEQKTKALDNLPEKNKIE